MTTMAYGDVYSCAINPVNDVDVFEFDGTAGETVLLTLSDRTRGVWGEQPKAEIYNPSAELIETLQIDNTGTTWQQALPGTGTYTVVVSEAGNDQGVNYSLGLQRIFPPLDSAMTLCVDCVLEDTVSPVADSDVMLFDGHAGDTVLLTLADRTSGVWGEQPKAEVYDPDDELLASLQVDNTGTIWQDILPQNGTYTIVITEAGNDQGVSYNVGLQRLFPAPNSAFFVGSGSVLAGGITPVGDSDIVLFDGIGGCTTRITLTDRTVGVWGEQPKAEIYNPAAELVTTLQIDNTGTTWQDELLETGTYTVVMTEAGNDQGVSYSLSRQDLFGPCPAPRPEISVITVPDPLRLTFPETVIGEESEPQTVTVRNDGGATLDVGSILLSGDDADQFIVGTDGCTARALDPTESCSIELSFSPMFQGAKSALLEIPSNDADEDPVYVVLATNHDEPEIAATPDPVTFGIVPVSGSQTRTVWIDNYGAAPLHVGAIGLAGPNANQFALTADDCSDRRLFSSQSCTLTLAFGPTSTGAKIAALQIPSDDPDEGLVELTLVGGIEGTITFPLTVAKTGVGAATIVSVPAGIDCGAACSANFEFGAHVALSVTPEAGSVFGAWTGDTDCFDGVVTMNGPKYCVAKFGEGRFDDVPFDYWAWQYIESIAIAGITTGCAPGLYCPADSVTRAQMAVFLLRGVHGSGYAPRPADGGEFADVAMDYWAAAWIEQLAAEGITTGCGDGNYCPEEYVSRAQMAVFLLRAKHGSGFVPPAATGSLFGDVPLDHWAAAWIEQLFAEGITVGCGGGNYCPASSVTRAEMAVFLARTFGLSLPPNPT
ncbi:MAG: choice-of-anchor D domain-containing protein [Planctomycetes bacterium]|nr:choice-of-anchor D domain-containing protein [Planctomycetota bacterium]